MVGLVVLVALEAAAVEVVVGALAAAVTALLPPLVPPLQLTPQAVAAAAAAWVVVGMQADVGYTRRAVVPQRLAEVASVVAAALML